MNELEEKYIQLILQRCINFEQSKSLMIHCDFKEHIKFAEKIKLACQKMGIFDVCIHVNDLDDIHEYLKNTPVDDIVLNPLIDKTDWDNYAIKGAPILRLHSSVPGLMDDIPSEKIKKWISESAKTTKYYNTNSSKYTFPWCIVAVPNERWAKTIFGDKEDSYDKLYLTIMKMCMLDKESPIDEWNNYIKRNNYYKNKLKELNVTGMHYTNSLGTDLYVEIPKNNNWINLDKYDAKGGQMIANMPSYEIFTSPDYRKTNGIVYASRPLFYNDSCIKGFMLEFREGKVISYSAKEGQDLLEEIINSDSNSGYLGEVALVPYDSPISNTGLIFNETLLDENASCHLALGRGFPKSINENDLNIEQLLDRGINQSSVHVDFMIGTEDLNIEANTEKGKMLIFKNGNFNI